MRKIILLASFAFCLVVPAVTWAAGDASAIRKATRTEDSRNLITSGRRSYRTTSSTSHRSVAPAGCRGRAVK